MNLTPPVEPDAPSRFKIISIEDQGRCATFELDDEDHTLGNALRHMILKNADVKFCGYALPHPNERKINFQLQVYKGDALGALKTGLENLRDLNHVVRDKITQAYEQHGKVDLLDSEDEDQQRVTDILDSAAKN